MTRLSSLTALLVVAVLAVACGDSGDSSGGSSAARSERWSFTDDAGKTATSDERPETIVMFEDVAASMIDLGVEPEGIHYINGVDGNRLFEGIDLDGVGTVGTTCEEVNLEALAALKPDLIVYMLWGEETFCLTPEQVPLVEQVAPLVQIQAVGSSDAIRERYLELAEALGADLDTSELAAKRTRFEAAERRLKAAVEARPEITVIPMSVAPDWVGVAEPASYPDLSVLRDRFGVRFAGPRAGVAEDSQTYWDELSAETITDHRGDVILMDAKNETSMDAKRAAYPTWAALPEVAASQIVPWWVPGSFSYTRDAKALELLADAITGAKDLVR